MRLDRAAPAADLLAAELVTSKSAGRWSGVRLLLVAAFGAVVDDSGATDGAAPAATPTVYGHLVVTRRDTGKEVLRTGTDAAEPDLLEHVRGQLAELTVGEFLDRWGVRA